MQSNFCWNRPNIELEINFLWISNPIPTLDFQEYPTVGMLRPQPAAVAAAAAAIFPRGSPASDR